ncbi:hypothetical protein BCR35DRAFT_335668 [Leucosporidium creatinivorum]|uniref:MARVEL domain-containing protein n=1 Tax=Leucosporidium creatinivorum TaxID=106004 RepID=A0A1Y2D6T3_9BASI|nr:hypothetical protein BCR35DRAFT_335668 [Leucosporidium creatinivorum]
MAPVSAHPFLFFLVGALATAQTGLTAYQIYQANHGGQEFPSEEWKNREIFMLFTAAWTLLFALLHYVINLYIGAFWSLITLIFWVIATVLWARVEDFHPSDCSGTSFGSFCRQVVAIEAIGWTEVALTALLFFATLFACHQHRRNSTYRDAGYRGYYV